MCLYLYTLICCDVLYLIRVKPEHLSNGLVILFNDNRRI